MRNNLEEGNRGNEEKEEQSNSSMTTSASMNGIAIAALQSVLQRLSLDNYISDDCIFFLKKNKNCISIVQKHRVELKLHLHGLLMWGQNPIIWFIISIGMRKSVASIMDFSFLLFCFVFVFFIMTILFVLVHDYEVLMWIVM